MDTLELSASLLTIKARDAQFQRLMHGLVVQCRTTSISREEFELERQKHFWACYNDVEKSLWPRPQD